MEKIDKVQHSKKKIILVIIVSLASISVFFILFKNLNTLEQKSNTIEKDFNDTTNLPDLPPHFVENDLYPHYDEIERMMAQELEEERQKVLNEWENSDGYKNGLLYGHTHDLLYRHVETPPKKSDYNKAIAVFTEAILLAPNDALAYRSRGNAYSYKGDYDNAIADFTQAITLNPYDFYAYHRRGFAYNSKGDYDKAIADYEEALRIEPNYTLVLQRLENARRLRGR
jgi:tetratricopeptide (TPR) repeat protein